MRRCEDRYHGGPDCGTEAVWLVRVGDRKSDQQLSCGTHLNRTCHALADAEGRSGTVLTVIPVPAASLT